MTGNDPDYISSMEHFESIPHEEIYAKAQQIDAAEVLRASVAWLEVSAALVSSFPLTHSSVDRVMNSMDWQGTTADAAYASARSFAASVDELAAIMGQVGARLDGVAAAAEAVKLAVVPPGSSGPIGAVAKMLESANVIDAQAAREALRHEALLAMNMVYKPAYRMAGTAVPALPAPPQPLVEPKPETQPARPESSHGHQIDPDNDSPAAPTPSAPESQAPPSIPVPETQQPTPEQPTPSEPVPQTQPAPSTRQAPPPPPSQGPLPTPPSVPEIPGPAKPPAPPPIPSPPEPPPIPGPAEPSPSLPDPGGQPGITGPIPKENQSAPSTTNQPGVIPSKH